MTTEQYQTKQAMKITVEYPCGHIDTYETKALSVPAEWHRIAPPFVEETLSSSLCTYELSEADAEKLR